MISCFIFTFCHNHLNWLRFSLYTNNFNDFVHLFQALILIKTEASRVENAATVHGKYFTFTANMTGILLE